MEAPDYLYMLFDFFKTEFAFTCRIPYVRNLSFNCISAKQSFQPFRWYRLVRLGIVGFFALFIHWGFCTLVTLDVISKWVLTCDSAHSWSLCCIAHCLRWLNWWAAVLIISYSCRVPSWVATSINFICHWFDYAARVQFAVESNQCLIKVILVAI